LYPDEEYQVHHGRCPDEEEEDNSDEQIQTKEITKRIVNNSQEHIEENLVVK
jgi:hypothetical protein